MRPSFFYWLLLGVLFSGCQTPPPPPPPPVATPTPEPIVAYTVSQEKYVTSLAEIRALADQLNGIIAGGKLQDWKNFLDDNYLMHYSDPVKLKDFTNTSPVLKQYDIKLKSLADYFTFVVVPSRSKVQVDEITFLDEERVEAWTWIKTQKVLLYQLRLYGKDWKISFW